MAESEDLAPSESSFSVISDSDISSTVSEPSGAPEISAVPADESHPPSVKHAKYFIKDRQVTFKIEGTLFRVHRFFFVRDSEYFRKLLGNADLEEESEQEWSRSVGLDGEPICLDGEGVRSIDFERFLDVLYPSDYGKHSLSSQDEWTSVLHLASKWGFESMRALAIREVFPMASPVDKIVLGRDYDIPDWLFGAYVAICARAEALTVDEGRRLGIDDAMQISAFRQELRPHHSAISVEDIERGVQRLFLFSFAPAADPDPDSTFTQDSPSAETSPDPSTTSTERTVATPAPGDPVGADGSTVPEALREVAEMIEAMADDNFFGLGRINGSFLLPHISAKIGTFNTLTIDQFAQHLADTVNSATTEKYVRICNHLRDSLDRSIIETDFGDLTRKELLFACLSNYCMAMPCGGQTGSQDAQLPTTPHIDTVRFLLAMFPSGVPDDLVTRCLAHWVARLDQTNCESICNLVELFIQRSGYLRGAGRREMSSIIVSVTQSTQEMGWRMACRGEALKQQWR